MSSFLGVDDIIRNSGITILILSTPCREGHVVLSLTRSSSLDAVFSEMILILSSVR